MNREVDALKIQIVRILIKKDTLTCRLQLLALFPHPPLPS